MSIFTKVWNWLVATFVHIEKDLVPVAISITEHVKLALDNGSATFVAEIVDALTKTGIGVEIVGLLERNITRILATELALTHPPVDASPEEIERFTEEIAKAVGGLNSVQKSKVWTTLAAQIVGIVRTHLGTAEGQTFAGWVVAVEEAYQAYQNDVANGG